ncbi:universal stress protein [Kitasatospora sp. NBC_01250]|uniref:universal stress protein n=1 Tax=unclassified Kitasatospora TaxID=2633591 RepID=UPI002E14094C|nr:MULTISPECIES: universal stress protein [unclassified Kitasatospora]WSJ71362.1 universal stress protein [Kitasatospora sp. NBC_01302]
MSSTITRVVVGVDGSESCLPALRQAAEEARRHRAELQPVILYSSAQGDYIDLRWPPEGPMARQLHDKAYGKLMASCERALGGLPEDVYCTPTAALGPPGPLLVSAARGEDVLLVLGSCPHGPVHRLLKGSVSGYCVRHCTGPVLLVPPEDPPRERPPEQHAPA